MAYNPGVAFFISFYELDPSKEGQCIFFTQKGKRCTWPCHESDKMRAIELLRTISAISSEAVSLDLLQEYVLCNCCRSSNARHRDRIEDVRLLIPLARRWQDEIRGHAGHGTPVPPPEQSIFTHNAYTTPATQMSSDTTTTIYVPSASPSNYHPNGHKSFSINATPLTSIASPSYYQHGSRRSSSTTELASQPFGSQHRYDLRSREDNVSNSTSTQPTSTSQPTQSEFRPHVKTPLPSDSVFRKILDPLQKRDFETGSLYIFDRASSPGHVKIGWTASFVSRRLDSWARCGYTPNLLLSVPCVPNAQRVETLTHHELIKEWRRERMCKGPRCQKSHQEWFEISKERAEQVLSNWADFMIRAEPYESEGCLKTRWRGVAETMDGNGEVLTAKKLLEHYEESLVEEAALVEEPVDPGHAPKIEEKADSEYVPKVGRREALEDATVRVSSLPMEEPASPEEIPLLKSEAVPEHVPPVESFFPMLATQPESELVHEELPTPQTTPVKKELLPEQIQLPPSPILQPTTFSQDTLSSQETKSSLSTGTKGTSAIDVIINSDTSVTVADTLSNSETNSLTSLSAPVSHSATPSEDLPHQTNADTSTETSTSTSSPSLNFSDNSSESSLSDSSAPSTPLRPKVEQVLLSMSTDEQDELAEVLTSSTLRQPNATGDGHEEDIESHDQDESTITEKGPGAGANGWDAERAETSVIERGGDQTRRVKGWMIRRTRRTGVRLAVRIAGMGEEAPTLFKSLAVGSTRTRRSSYAGRGLKIA